MTPTQRSSAVSQCRRLDPGFGGLGRRVRAEKLFCRPPICEIWGEVAGNSLSLGTKCY